MKDYLEVYLRVRDITVNALRRYLHSSGIKIRYDNSEPEALGLVFRKSCEPRQLQAFHNWFVAQGFQSVVTAEYFKNLTDHGNLKVTVAHTRIDFEHVC
jgi:hypothetical protein